MKILLSRELYVIVIYNDASICNCIDEECKEINMFNQRKSREF